MKDPGPRLPDIQSDRLAVSNELSLEWVGMSEIESPVLFKSLDGEATRLAARVDAAVNLVDPQARGIHMSRLYRTVVEALPNQVLSFELLESLIENFLHTQNGLSSAAEIRVRFEALVRRESLKSGLKGYRSYPVEMRVTKASGLPRRFLKVDVLYSSTCPQSAALSRQEVAKDFSRAFPQAQAETENVRSWLESPAGMAATPHAQRSRARVQVEVQARAAYSLENLIDLIETTLGTPVQTVVKREDEQEFARRNGTHLMFCEDAARQLKKALWTEPALVNFEGEVRHMESLHPHDAVARIQGRGPLFP